MSTTTIRVADELRARVESVATASGSTAHTFMLEATADATERMERRQDFVAEAERRLQHMQDSGKYLGLEELRGYAMALARGEKPTKPTPNTMAAEELKRFSASMRRSH